MKKFISALAVVFAIAASYSCQREVDYITDPAQAVTVTYSVSLDQVQKTKATLAELDALAVDKLFYSVYQSNGTAFNAIAHSDYHGSVALTGNTAELQFKLIQGETYKLVFWAQKGDSYITSAVTKDSPLGEISIDYTACDSYAADRDAFTAWDEITLDPVTQGADFATSFSKEIHLKRPFAQVNFGTDDAAQAAAQGYVASKVQVIVKQAATKFNALTGIASEPVDASFKEVALPETPVEFDINNATYTRVAKAYVLPVGTFTVTQDGTSAAISSPLSTTPEVSMILSVKKGENVLALDPRSRANTSIRSNYRTNLLGHLITTDATFNVVVDNDYDGSTDHISIVSLGNATGSNAITMGEDEIVKSNINFGDHPVTLDATMTIEGNVTISSNESNAAATITVNAPIVVTTGSTLTLEGVTIDPASTNATITIQPGATVIVNGGTYTADGNHSLFDLLTNSNPNPAPAKPGMHFAHGADGDQLIIRGGVFTGFDPTPYVDDVHYSIVEDPTNTWTVTAKQVTLTVEAGDVSMKLGDEAVLKTLTVDPADTDLSGISFEYSVANVAAASYSEGKISIAAVGAGSTVITVKVGAASATINVTVLPADSIEVAPASLSLKVGQTSEAVTVTLNNNATVSSVASNNANATVNWTSGNTFTVTGAAIGESTVTVTASNGKTATVAVTVSKADAVKLAAPVLSTENADADETSIVLSWTAVEHASGYAVSYGAESPVNVSTNEVTLSNLALATEYTISVVAKGDGDAYTDSDASNAIVVPTDKGQSVIAIAQGKDAYTITVGLTANIEGVSITYNNEAITGATPVYTVDSSDADIISVANGVITAKAVGEAAIAVDYAGNATYKAAEQQIITVNVIAATLESITVDATAATKTFTVGDTFNHNNVTVTANYNNNTTADVTAQATFSEPDMTTAGTKTVTVTYQGKSDSYEITVNPAAVPVLQSVAITTPATNTTFTVGDAFDASGLVLTGTYDLGDPKVLTPSFKIGSEIVTSGTTILNEEGQKTVTVFSAENESITTSYTITVEAAALPAIQDVTVAQFLAASTSETQRYRLTGIVGGSVNVKYGNFDLTDQTGTVYIYGLFAEEVDYGASNPGNNILTTLGLEAGDRVTIVGYRGVHNESPQAVYSYHESHVDALAAPANLTVGKTNDKKITASWDAVSGAASYTLKIGEDEIENASSPFTSASAYADGTYSVSVKAVGSTAPDSPFSAAQSVTIGDVQLANPAVFTFSEMGYENQTNLNEVPITIAPITFEANKGTNSNNPQYFTSGTAVRIYGGSYFTISSDKYITSVSLTFGSSDGSNEISTNVGSYNNGSWTGAAQSVTFTIGGTTGNRRLSSISVSWTAEAPQSYSITCADNLNGGTIAADKATAMAGEVVTLTATPAEHYLFGNWSVNNGDVTVTNNKFTMPAANVTVSATFTAAQQYGISIASGIQNGSIAVYGGANQAYEGDEVEITVTPATGYVLSSLTYQQGSNAAVAITKDANDKYKFTMPGGDVTVNAVFEEEGNNTGTSYTKVTSAPADWSGTYLIVYESSATAGIACTAGTDAEANHVDVTISSGTITSEALSAQEVLIEAYGNNTGEYAIKALGGANSGKYIQGKGSSSNGTNFMATASIATTLAIDASSKVVTITNNTDIFVYNSATTNGNRWRFYKSTTASGSGYYKPVLYKKN